MKEILEVKGRDKFTQFKVLEKKGDKILSTRTVSPYVVHCKDKGMNTWLLYNTNGDVVDDAYRYVNNAKYISNNTRKKRAYDLRLILAFAEIFELDFLKFTRSDLVLLTEFLHGGNIEGEELEVHLFTKRSRETVKMIINAYKKFIISLNLPDAESRAVTLFKASDVFSSHSRGKGHDDSIVGRALSAMSYKEVPKYISEKEFHKLMECIEKSEYNNFIKLRDKIILSLMFLHGLRIGEVLGLTLEDFKIVKTKNDNEFCEITIRNRLTDETYQLAKTCMNVRKASEYCSNEYNSPGIGYQKVPCNIFFYDMLVEYTDVVHGFAQRKHIDRYKLSQADAVGDYAATKTKNYYIFVNKYYKKLSGAAWNAHLKELFIAAGIEVDKNHRQNNLSHRFRHGYAMSLIHSGKYDFATVQKLMRHKSPTSTSIYYNPTDDEIVALKEQMETKVLKGLNKDEYYDGFDLEKGTNEE